MKKFRNLSLLLLVLVAVFVLAACGRTDDENGDTADTGQVAAPGGDVVTQPPVDPGTGERVPVDGGDLVVAIMTMPVSMMLDRNDSASSLLANQIYDTLVWLSYDETNSDLTPVPSLATSWDVIDAQTFRFTLREGVTFHNGAPLTSYDVQFSLERAALDPEASVVSNMIDHVEVHDDLNFTIHLNIPFIPFISNLGHTIMGIMHRDSYLADPDTPVGTGPFQFDSLSIGEYVRLTRFEDHWGTLAHVDSLTFRAIGEGSIRVIEAQGGQVHVGMDIQPADIRAAEASVGATVFRRDNLSMNYIGFNMQEGSPFYNPLVRRAVNYAVDVEAIIEAVFEGLGRPLQGVPLSDVNRDFTPGLVAPINFNINRARELMEEAGYADGFSANLWYNAGNMARAAMAEIVGNQLGQINIDVTIDALEWEFYLDRTGNFEHDMFFLGWVSVVGDLDYALHPLFHSSNIGPAGNRFPINSPVLDQLLDDARVETDPAARLAMYQEAMILLDYYLPMVLLNQGEFAVLVNDAVGGFVVNPAGHHSFARVYFYSN